LNHSGTGQNEDWPSLTASQNHYSGFAFWNQSGVLTIGMIYSNKSGNLFFLEEEIYTLSRQDPKLFPMNEFSTIPKNVVNLAKAVKKEIFSYFGKRVKCILIFGSYSSGFYNKFSDVDLWFFLDKYNFSDLKIANRIHSLYRPRGLSLTIKWLDELIYKNPLYVSHKGNGQFLVAELQRAIVIYGKNPYTKFPLNSKEIKKSIVIKVEKILTEYRKTFIKNDHPGQEEIYDVLKHTIRATRYLLLSEGVYPTRENMLILLEEYFPQLLNTKEITFLNKKFDTYLKGKRSLKNRDLILCLGILRKYYIYLISH